MFSGALNLPPTLFLNWTFGSFMLHVPYFIFAVGSGFQVKITINTGAVRRATTVCVSVNIFMLNSYRTPLKADWIYMHSVNILGNEIPP